MKRIKFDRYIKKKFITSIKNYKIITEDNEEYIYFKNISKFKIITNYKTQFNELLIIEGNIFNLLNILITELDIKFITDYHLNKKKITDLLYWNDKSIFDYYEEELDIFNYTKTALLYYDGNYFDYTNNKLLE